MKQPVLIKAAPSSMGPPEDESQPWSALLELFYSRAGLPPPRLERLGVDKMPQPYRKLLVHSMDLTPTLEAFYRRTLALTVLSRRREGASYMREVVLRLAGSGKRVGYGVIRIALEHLPPKSAMRVLENQVPFGSILQRDAIPHLSWPQAFFSVEADPHLKRVLGLPESCRLYGRRNVLLNGSRRLLAEVIEVLASVSSDPARGPGRNFQRFGRNGDATD
jgi:chorismate-pyruvate lyase